ncbi:TIGR03620 family F420-dependent LLM class oxidoreductase [Rhodococcus koreensis]|uniref:TIGR03620 family F420-dependent LLM class oxidoreductase n=1 Tax=Rhodococcus koreensis TaxID=99653 RepID=UPI0036724D83
MMNLGPIGIWSLSFLAHPDKGEIAEAAAELEDLGFGALFMPGWAGGDEIFPSLERLLAATEFVPVVSGVVNIWKHTPEDVATAYASFEREHPGRFHLGLGISHEVYEPVRYRRPVATMGAYLDELDRAERPDLRERRLLGALGPRMLDLARERTAGSHTYLAPVEHTRSARERLGPDAVIAVEQHIVLEADATTAREQARASMADYLTLPNYTNNLLRHGFDEDDLRDGGSDRLVDAIVVWGDDDAIAQRVAAHREAGASHVCLQVVGGVEATLPRESWRRLAALTDKGITK